MKIVSKISEQGKTK